VVNRPPSLAGAGRPGLSALLGERRFIVGDVIKDVLGRADLQLEGWFDLYGPTADSGPGRGAVRLRWEVMLCSRRGGALARDVGARRAGVCDDDGPACVMMTGP
jgi:hypothetical protein